MTNGTEALINELQQEATTTRRLLERVPTDQLKWAPHTKSMTLGQLALHVASIPGGVSKLLSSDGFDGKKANFRPPQPESTEEILSAFDAAIQQATQVLQSWDEATAGFLWSLSKGEEKVFTLPRVVAARSLMMNHLYHHRGQLTVYLRLLDVLLPVTYGRSADMNPFA